MVIVMFKWETIETVVQMHAHLKELEIQVGFNSNESREADKERKVSSDNVEWYIEFRDLRILNSIAIGRRAFK